MRDCRSVSTIRAGLLLDVAVLLGDERVVREDEIADGAADLERRAARDDARAGRAALEHLNDAKRRRPLGRRVEIGRVGRGLVVGDRVLLDAQELIADDELVAGLDLDRPPNAQKDAVSALEVLEEEPAAPPPQDGFARVTEALARERDAALDAEDDLVADGLVDVGPAPETAQHVEAEAETRRAHERHRLGLRRANERHGLVRRGHRRARRVGLGRRGRTRRLRLDLRLRRARRQRRRLARRRRGDGRGRGRALHLDRELLRRRGFGALLLDLLDVDVRRLGEHLHAAEGAPLDDRVELSVAQRDDHLHLLPLHELAHVEGDVRAADRLGVVALVALDDAAAVGEEVRDDVRLVEAAVLRLDVEDLVLVLDVVVEADLSAVEARLAHLALELCERVGRPVLHRALEVDEVAVEALHPRERGLGERRRRVDAQGAREELLPVGVVRSGCSPGAQDGDGVIDPPLVDQPFRYLGSGSTRRRERALRHSGGMILRFGGNAKGNLNRPPRVAVPS